MAAARPSGPFPGPRPRRNRDDRCDDPAQRQRRRDAAELPARPLRRQIFQRPYALRGRDAGRRHPALRPRHADLPAEHQQQERAARRHQHRRRQDRRRLSGGRHRSRRRHAQALRAARRDGRLPSLDRGVALHPAPALRPGAYEQEGDQLALRHRFGFLPRLPRPQDACLHAGRLCERRRDARGRDDAQVRLRVREAEAEARRPHPRGRSRLGRVVRVCGEPRHQMHRHLDLQRVDPLPHREGQAPRPRLGADRDPTCSNIRRA